MVSHSVIVLLACAEQIQSAKQARVVTRRNWYNTWQKPRFSEATTYYEYMAADSLPISQIHQRYKIKLFAFVQSVQRRCKDMASLSLIGDHFDDDVVV